MVDRLRGKWKAVLTFTLTTLLVLVMSPRPTGASVFGKSVPTVSLMSSLNPSYVGQTVTLTATVAVPAGDPVPTGDVRFMDGSNLLETVALNGSAQAVHVNTTFISANHAVRAEYLGDATTSPGTSPAIHQLVYRNTPIVAGTTSPSPSRVGEAVTVTVTVEGASGAPTPTGNVNFSADNAPLATVALDGAGHASVVTSALAAGPHTITATYQGSIAFQSGMTNVPHTVEKSAAEVSLVSSNNPSLAGLPVTFTATVRGSAVGAPPGTGAVVFKEGATVLSMPALDANGQATFTTSSLAAGTHTLAVEYAGDGYYLDGASAPLVQTVNLVGASVSLVSSDNPSLYGQLVTFTATATGSSVVPTGVMTFKDGSTVLGNAPLDGSGVATYSTGALDSGSHDIAAEYAGDGVYAPGATGMLTQIVDRAPTGTSLAVSTGRATTGAPITWTATVTSMAVGAIGGTVTFIEGLTLIGTGTLSAGGVATTSATLPAGTHEVNAIFGGDTNFEPSASPSVTTVVSEPDAGSADAGSDTGPPPSDGAPPADALVDVADAPPTFDSGSRDADSGRTDAAVDVQDDPRADAATQDTSNPMPDVAMDITVSSPDAASDNETTTPVGDARSDIATDVARSDGGVAPPPDDDRGCGCRVGGHAGSRACAALGGALVAITLLRRRRRRVGLSGDRASRSSV